MTDSTVSTRIEVKTKGKSKTITIAPVDAKDLKDELYSAFSDIKKTHVIESCPITKNPSKDMLKCRVEVYEVVPEELPKKINFNSFTIYGESQVNIMKKITELCLEKN